MLLKGLIVWPKNKFCHPFTHPHVVPNCFVSHWLPLYFLAIQWKSMGTKSVSNILQNIFCVQQKKLIHVWDNMRWSVSFRAIQKLENILYNIVKYVQFTCKYLSIQRVDRTWIWKWTTSGHLVAVILCKCELSFRRYRGEKRHTLDMEYLSFFLILFLRADSLCLPATEWDRWRGKCRSLCMPSARCQCPHTYTPVSLHYCILTVNNADSLIFFSPLFGIHIWIVYNPKGSENHKGDVFEKVHSVSFRPCFKKVNKNKFTFEKSIKGSNKNDWAPL